MQGMLVDCNRPDAREAKIKVLEGRFDQEQRSLEKLRGTDLERWSGRRRYTGS